MDKQDWTPEKGTKVWFTNYYGIDHGVVLSVRGVGGMGWIDIEYDCSGALGVLTIPPVHVFRTKTLAKAALIEKLTQALEEARKL